MQSTVVLEQYEQLPDIYKQEAGDFIEFLFLKTSKSKGIISKSRGGLGMSKGKYNMSKDFDEPLDDFKEYIQ
jgi:hypothetical protein